MRSSIYVALLVMMLLAVGQTAVWPYFPIFGLHPQFPFLVALSWALLRGRDEGLLWAFIAGLFLDLFSITPLGVTSLAFMLSIVSVIWIEQALPTSRFLLPIVLATLATLVYLLVYLILMRISGYLVDFQTAGTLAPLALLHGGLILPVYWVMYTIDRAIRPRPVQI